MMAYSNQGAYASHGHAIAANGLTAWRLQYACPNIRGEAYTIYTNTPVGGAMRAYGIPEAAFAIECFMDDIAAEIHMDPLEFRRKNLIKGYYEDAYLKPIAATQTEFLNVWKRRGIYPLGRKRKKYASRRDLCEEGWECPCFAIKPEYGPYLWRSREPECP